MTEENKINNRSSIMSNSSSTTGLETRHLNIKEVPHQTIPHSVSNMINGHRTHQTGEVLPLPEKLGIHTDFSEGIPRTSAEVHSLRGDNNAFPVSSNFSWQGQNEDKSQTNDTSKYPEYCQTLTVRDASGQVKELVFPKGLDLDRPKRARTTFSAEQLYHLEREFLRNQYMVGKERTDLAQRLNLSETQVKVWFQNRRTKLKKDKQREDEMQHATAETVATCNILRLLQNRPPPPAPGNLPFPPVQSAQPPGMYRTNVFMS